MKKDSKVDLDKKRVLFLSVGLLISLTLVLTAFEFKTSRTPTPFVYILPPSEIESVNTREADIVVVPAATSGELQRPTHIPASIPESDQKSSLPLDRPATNKDRLFVCDFQADLFTPDLEDIDINIDTELLTLHPDEQYQDTIPVIDVPDTEAYFPGGIKAWKKFLDENLEYPKGVQASVEGKVFLSFVIDSNGKPSQIEVIRGLKKEFDEEAIRVLELSPNWVPATLNGTNVRNRMLIIISFSSGS